MTTVRFKANAGFSAVCAGPIKQPIVFDPLRQGSAATALISFSFLQWRDLVQKAIYKDTEGGKRPPNWQRAKKVGNVMWRIFKLLFFISILAGAAFVAYAYIGPIFFPADFAAPTQQVSQPLVLETQ